MVDPATEDDALSALTQASACTHMAIRPTRLQEQNSPAAGIAVSGATLQALNAALPQATATWPYDHCWDVIGASAISSSAGTITEAGGLTATQTFLTWFTEVQKFGGFATTL